MGQISFRKMLSCYAFSVFAVSFLGLQIPNVLSKDGSAYDEKVLQKVKNAMKKSDHEAYLRNLTYLANQGYDFAESQLGIYYKSGGFYYIGESNGLLNADDIVSNIDKSRVDLIKAVYWLNKAADQGYALAQVSLGQLFEQGKGVKYDLSQALFWYKKAATQGDKNAQGALDDLQETIDKGNGSLLELRFLDILQFLLRKDTSISEKSVSSYQKDIIKWNHTNKNAAFKGDLVALVRLATQIYYKQVNKNMDYAAFFFNQAANKNHAIAQYYLGVLYETGQGFKKDIQKAIVWYGKSAKQNLKEAKYELARISYYGLGVKKDLNYAFKLYLQAAKQGDAQSQTMVGFMYLEGEVVAKNYEQAFYWSKKSAEQNESVGKSNLAELFRDGKGVAINYERALSLYLSAAKDGIAEAQYQTGLFYQQGKGTQKDLVKATYWFKKASDQGYVASTNSL